MPTQIKTRAEHARLIGCLLSTGHKRNQVNLGGVWTLAGYAMMWRTDALRRISGISTGTIVEDMAASWKGQATESKDKV